MTGSSKFSLLIQPGLEDSLQPGYRSMKFDPLVWKAWEKLTEEESVRISGMFPGRKLDPGNFAMYLLNPDLISLGYPDTKLQTPFLEDCMNEFQLFLQHSQPPIDLIQAAKLMVVLAEKRKISPSWETMLSELSSRFHEDESELFLEKWKTTFGILVNLIDDKLDFVSSFFNEQIGKKSEDLFFPVIMMLCQPDTERVALGVEAIGLIKPEQQVEILRDFIILGETEFSYKLATHLAEGYRGIDTSPLTAEDHWKALDGNLSNSHLYQIVAMIAQIAGDVEFANKLLSKADEILKAALTGVQLQKLSASQGSDVGDMFKVSLFADNESLINKELGSYKNIHGQGNLQGSSTTSQIVKQSKEMTNAGNDEVALNIIAQEYQKSPIAFISNLKDIKPKFNVMWEPVHSAQDLVEIGADEQAEELVAGLLNQNPVNQAAVSNAIQLYKKRQDWFSLIPLLEGRVHFGKPSSDDLRDLVVCYTQTDEDRKSFEISARLVSSPESTISEKNNHALIALKIGEICIARKTIDDVLAVEPENSIALCISGKTFVQEGTLDYAKIVLKKAIDRETELSDPWITLSEVYSIEADNQAALSILQGGLVALPKNREIKLRLARTLFENGSTAEALPLLNDIRNDFPDIDSSILLLKSMKNLHLEETDELVKELFQEHPENPEIAYEFASLCLTEGDYQCSTRILKGLLGEKQATSDWVLTYADAAFGLNPKWARKSTNVQEIELDHVLQDVNNCLIDSPDNGRGRLIQAEILLQKGLIEEAHKILSRLLENNSGEEKTWMERIQTWFAWTAATLGKFDVALASIRDVMDAEPEWIGARQVLAEIIAMTDDVQGALEQAEIILELAPEIADNQLWVGGFFSRLGEDEKAEKVFLDGMQLEPDDVRFDLALTNLYVSQGKEDLARPIVEGLKKRILIVLDERVLSDSAKVLEENGESKAVEDFLQQRLTDNKNFQNAIDLAGYYYQHNRFENSLTILESIGVSQGHLFLLNCLKADTQVRLAGYNQAFQIIESLQEYFKDSAKLNPSGFTPPEWIQISNSESSALELKMRINFEIGEVEQALLTVKEARNIDFRSGLMILIALEASLASGKQDWGEDVIDIAKIDRYDPWYDLLAAQQIGHSLDTGKVDEAWEMFNKLDKRTRSSLFIKVVEANLLSVEGNTNEAEELFEEILISDILENNRPLFEQAGVYRLLISTAIRLSRWKEALEWAHEFSKRVPWHQINNMLYLTTLVRSLEYREICKTIDILVHSPEESLSQLDVIEEFEWLRQNSNGNELQERWFLRGNLAFQPSQENIKAFALQKPTPEDAAAIMAALRKIGHLNTALQLGKKFAGEPSILMQIAQSQAEKDLDAAITTLNSLIGVSSTNAVAIRLRAEYHKRAGHSDLAVKDVETALLLWKNEFAWRKTAAELWTKLGNETNAVQQLRLVYESSPDDFKTGLNLGKGFTAIGESKKAIELLQELAKNNPNRAELWETLTDAYLADGNTSNALETAGKASELNPSSVKPYLLRAQAYLDEGNVDDALLQVAKADQLVKNNADVKIFMAKLLFQKGDKAGALAALEDATRCKDLSPKTILDEIKLIREINGSASAKNLIEYFSQQMPENVELLSMLADSQLENGDLRAAELSARRALKIAPDSLTMLIFLGKQQIKKGQLDQAIQSFSQVIKLYPDCFEAYFLLGEVYEKQREYAKAIEILKQVIEQRPGDIQAYISLASLYKNAKNYRLAEEMLKRAVDIDPKNVSIKRQLGALLALNLVHQSQEVSSQL